MNLRTCQQSMWSISRAMVICGASLCFAAMPGLAQRGGGHGAGHAAGGAHFGGVGGHGGVRGAAGAAGARGASGAGRGLGSAEGFRSGAGRGMNGTRSAYEIAAMQSRSGASTRGYSREVFVPASGSRQFLPPSTRFVGANGNMSAVGSHVFAASNYFWEAPPQQGRPAPTQAPRPAMPLNQMPRPVMMPPQRPLNMPANPLARPIIPRPIYMPMQRNPMRAPVWRPNPVALPPIARAMARPLVRPLQRPLSTSRPTPLIGMTPQPRTFGVPAFRFRPPMLPMGGIGVRGCFDTFGDFGGCGFGFGFWGPFFFPPIGFGCFGFFNPCGMGFGPFGGFGDLFLGNGWGNGWFYPPAPEIPPPPVNPTESNPPPDYSTGYFYLPEVPYSEPQANAQQKQTVKLVLKDGTIFDVYSYWLQDNQLYYITTYNIKTSIPVDDLDLQKTVDLNQKLGVTFTLSNKPPEQQQPPEQP